jgi:hypothetical protein
LSGKQESEKHGQKLLNDIHWLAGFLEGEGTFCTHGKTNIVISINQKSKEPLLKVAELLQGKVKGPYKSSSKTLGFKPTFLVQITGYRAAGWMMTLYSLMSKRRKKQIKKTLVRWSKIKGRGGKWSERTGGAHLQKARQK